MLLFGSEAHGHSHEDNNNEEDSHSGDHNHSHGDRASSGAQMNIKGVFLHVMADALGSVVVIISAVVIWQTDWEYRCRVVTPVAPLYTPVTPFTP